MAVHDVQSSIRTYSNDRVDRERLLFRAAPVKTAYEHRIALQVLLQFKHRRKQRMLVDVPLSYDSTACGAGYSQCLLFESSFCLLNLVSDNSGPQVGVVDNSREDDLRCVVSLELGHLVFIGGHPFSAQNVKLLPALSAVQAVGLDHRTVVDVIVVVRYVPVAAAFARHHPLAHARILPQGFDRVVDCFRRPCVALELKVGRCQRGGNDRDVVY